MYLVLQKILINIDIVKRKFFKKANWLTFFSGRLLDNLLTTTSPFGGLVLTGEQVEKMLRL